MVEASIKGIRDDDNGTSNKALRLQDESSRVEFVSSLVQLYKERKFKLETNMVGNYSLTH